MDAGVASRIRIAGVVALAAIAAFAALVAGAGTAQSNPGDPLLPDLRVKKPEELYLQGDNKRTLRIRFSNTVMNLGNGPLELTQNPETGPDSCQAPGQPFGRETIQNVYEDSNHGPSDDFFIRGSDSDFNEASVGCSRYHPAHDHWHFDNFANYALYREKTGKLAGKAKKISFCIIDGPTADETLPGFPVASYYPQDPGEPFASCSGTSTNGLSIGYSDLYGAGLRGQGIDVTGQKHGRFCLVLRVDPGSPGDPDGQLQESNPDNNVTGQRVAISPKNKKVRRLSGACKTPLPSI